ncbi:MAG: hypothetical protein M3209_00300 [Acidobacteriota bacterium]|nr:hypothetical protein [Acidobacteriota bacterium]
MAFEQPIILDSSKNAAADLSTKQFFLVKETSNGIELCGAATDKPAGVLQNQPKQGEPAQIMRLGISKVIVAAAIGVGAQIGTDATGKAAAKVAGTDTTNYVVGSLIEASTGANQIVTAAVNFLNIHRAA